MAITRTSSTRVPMDSLRKTALVAGVFYLVSFISIPSLALYGTVKGEGFILGSASATGALWAAVLEVIVALAGIGSAITLYPVVRRQNESLALGFVATRTLEAAMILVGVASILSLIALRQAGASGAEAASLTTVGDGLAVFYDKAFLLGQSLVPPLNALLLGTLMYRSGLVPRLIPRFGLVGAPLQLTAVVLTMVGVIDRSSAATGLLVIPLVVWELSLGVYLVVKGFKPSPITAGMLAAGSSVGVRMA